MFGVRVLLSACVVVALQVSAPQQQPTFRSASDVVVSSLVVGGVQVTVGEGEQKTQDLRIGT